jgi:hypothetical protein
MTVVAAIFAAQPASALADVDGVPAARHLAIVADEGGASQVLVVSFDPDGAVATAIEGVAELVQPAAAEAGPVAQFARAIDAARALDETVTAVLLCPARAVWADEWSVRALIAAQSHHRPAIIRPSQDGQPDWPALYPVAFRSALDGLAADLMPDAILEAVGATGLPLQVIPIRPSA